MLRPGGRLAVAVWDDVVNSPGYAAMVELLQGLFGEVPADALRAPFSLGDRTRLMALFESAGIVDAQLRTETGTARFASLSSWVRTDIKGWTLADLIDDAQFEALQHAAPSALSRFVRADGSVSFASPAHIVTARKQRRGRLRC